MAMSNNQRVGWGNITFPGNKNDIRSPSATEHHAIDAVPGENLKDDPGSSEG
jgi:hypothetical protein